MDKNFLKSYDKILDEQAKERELKKESENKL